MSDRGYTNLLAHLSRANTTLALTTIQTSIAYYLANIEPSPTPLAGTVISSPLFRLYTYVKLEVLSTAFRHAAHIKARQLKDAPGGLFARSMHAQFDDWTRAVLKGFQGGKGMLRLVCSGGLLLGLADWEKLASPEGRARGAVEEELVVALAEVMDIYSYRHPEGWENDFQPDMPGEDAMSTALLMSSQYFPLVASHRITALPLQRLADLTMSSIESAFWTGRFLADLPKSLIRNAEGKLCISPASPFTLSLQKSAAAPAMTSMAPLSKMCARSISVLADSRPQLGWPAMTLTMQRLQNLTRIIESDWLKTPLSATINDNEIETATRDITTVIWLTLKTLLFMTLMISQSIVTAIVYVPPPSALELQSEELSPFALALTILDTLSHIAFVMPHFGGITSTSESSFPELKRVFYIALDILSSNVSESERFVIQLCGSSMLDDREDIAATFLHAKKAYALACIEQLVPILSDNILQTHVYPLCLPHLNDSSNRETYESAHSVMLAIFASHAQSVTTRASGKSSLNDKDKSRVAFAELIVPFYADCLLDNSRDGKLSTAQLCLAYSALVRSAGASSQAIISTRSSGRDGDTYSWFCIEKLLGVIKSPYHRQEGALTPPSIGTSSSAEELHRLHRTLIATVSSLPLTLLPRVLDEILRILCPPAHAGTGYVRDAELERKRDDLVLALFKEISDNIGDAEKEFTVRWWHENCATFGGLAHTEPSRNTSQRSSVVSHL